MMNTELKNFVSRANKRVALECFLLTGAFIFSFAGVFMTLIQVWLHNSVYSHGFLVPFISVYIVWLQRADLSRLKASPKQAAGLGTLVTGLLMLLAGNAAGIAFLQDLSFIVAITGIVLAVLGSGFLYFLWFPIVYLLFMTRFWELVIIRLHLPLQNFTAFLGAGLLHLAGIPAFRDAIYIELPNITLEVAKVCSGVNYLISVAAIGIPLAYVKLRSWPKRIILVAGALAMSVLANGVRVAMIGTLAFYNITADLHGPYHVLQAMFVSVVGFILLFIGAAVLSRGERRADGFKPAAHPLDPPKAGRRAGRIDGPLVVTAVMLAAAGVLVNFYRLYPHPVAPGKDIRTFPYKIGGWSGVEGRPEYDVFRKHGVDVELARTYTDGGRKINLYIGYYEYQDQEKKLVNYETSELLSNGAREKIGLADGTALHVNEVRQKEGPLTRDTFFWYDIDGRKTADMYRARLFILTNSILRFRSNGAVILVSGAPAAAEDRNGSIEGPRDFIKSLAPVLDEYLSGGAWRD